MKNKTIIENFEQTPAFTSEVRADVKAVWTAITAQVILSKTGAYSDLRAALTDKYCEHPEIRQYLTAIARDYCTALEAYAKDAAVRIQAKGSKG